MKLSELPKNAKLADFDTEIYSLKEIRPHPENPREHPESQYGKLCMLLERFDYTKGSVVVQKGTTLIIAGSGIHESLMRQGFTHVRAVIADLDDPKALEFMVADNRSAELSDFNMGKLSTIFVKLTTTPGAKLEATAFQLPAITRIIEKQEAQDDGFNVGKALEEEAFTKSGDLWLLGDHKLLCGDSTKASDVDRLMGDEVADIVFTDPPYGIEYLPDSDLKELGMLASDTKDFEEFRAFIFDIMKNLFAALREGGVFYLFMGWEQMESVLWAIRTLEQKGRIMLVWNRVMPRLTGYPQDYIPVCEFFIYGWKLGEKRNRPSNGFNQTTIWSIKTMRGQEMVHTTEKPVALPYDALLNSSNENDLVLDLFAGSGSTLIAADQTRRRFVGMEIDRKYCDVIAKRYVKYIAKSDGVCIQRDGKKISWHEVQDEIE